MFRLIYTMPLYKVCLVMVLLLVLWAYYRAYLPKKLFWLMNLCVLVVAVSAVLYLTVFSRKVGTYDIVLVPFSALSEAKKEPERYRSMLMNVFLFFPLGMACANAFSDKMKMRRRVILVVAIGFALSTAVEYIQYRFSLGMAETDDVICNTLGAFVGSLSVILADFLGKHKKK